jgi:hypothetical protein
MKYLGDSTGHLQITAKACALDGGFTPVSAREESLLSAVKALVILPRA